MSGLQVRGPVTTTYHSYRGVVVVGSHCPTDAPGYKTLPVVASGSEWYLNFPFEDKRKRRFTNTLRKNGNPHFAAVTPSRTYPRLFGAASLTLRAYCGHHLQEIDKIVEIQMVD